MTHFEEDLRSAISETRAVLQDDVDPDLEYRFRGSILWEVRRKGRAEWTLVDDGARAVRCLSPSDFADLAGLLKAMRGALRQGQVAMAELMGVSTSAYEKWEQGRRTPRGPGVSLVGVLLEGPAPILAGRARLGTMQRSNSGE